MNYDVVIPTAGRPSLHVLLATLGGADGPLPRRVIVVDDRPEGAQPLTVRPPAGLNGRVSVVRSDGRGPAAARNAGWRAASAPWVVFVDDDVVPAPGWRVDLERDLRSLPEHVVGSQGRIRVPLPRHRRPTDWERNVGGLEHARWATADLAYRRASLEAVGGFDERFPRAYREDSDIALRLTDRGWKIAAGQRSVLHPVGTADRWVSVRKQAGNADDALMDALHGRDWRERAGAPRGRFSRHAATTAAGVLALGALAAGRRRTASAAGTVWAACTAEFAWSRLAPGPKTPDEVATMLATSALIPPAATLARLRGMHRARRLTAEPDLVLLDRDGTLVRDVPYNGDPELVEPLPGVREGLDRLRARGVRVGIVSNQSGIGRGLIGEHEAAAVMARVDELLGPFDAVRWCPHAPEDGCGCRKPAPGLLLSTAAALGVDPRRCAMIGDIGADVEAARAAGMRAVLVPTDVTRPEEIAAANETAPTFTAAVARLLELA